MAWEDVIPRSGRIVGEGCEVTVAWRRTGTDTSPRLVVNLAVTLCKRLGLLSKDRIRLQRDLKAGKLRLSKIDDKAPPAMKKLGFSLNLKDGTGYVVFRLDGVESAPQRAKHVPYEVSDEERAVVLTLPDWGAPERVAFERKSAAVKQAVALAKGADLSPQEKAEREDIIEARMMIERGDTNAKIMEHFGWTKERVERERARLGLSHAGINGQVRAARLEGRVG